jgi:hypothetical protein
MCAWRAMSCHVMPCHVACPSLRAVGDGLFERAMASADGARNLGGTRRPSNLTSPGPTSFPVHTTCGRSQTLRSNLTSPGSFVRCSPSLAASPDAHHPWPPILLWQAAFHRTSHHPWSPLRMLTIPGPRSSSGRPLFIEPLTIPGPLFGCSPSLAPDPPLAGC